jgi:hypothetical protein
MSVEEIQEGLKPVINEMKQLKIAVQSLNPDPAATIQAYRDQREAQQRAADHLVVATKALVGATQRLATATWTLVILTAVVAISTAWPIVHGLSR